jgi:predicted amidophosphoribosyltransferase
MKINPTNISRSFWQGVALDYHTISSKVNLIGQFETTRTELGEALYQLKYKFDRSKIPILAQVVSEYIRKSRIYHELKAIIPVPPSNFDRPFQPVLELTKSIAEKIALPSPENYLLKIKETQALKEIEDNDQRRLEMQDAFKVVDQCYRNESVLLFDDLYRSGETLNAVCQTLKNQGNVKMVYCLTITRTRTKR